MAKLTRRTFLGALPLVGAAAVAPAAMAIPVPQTRQEQIDHHVAELVRLMSEVAGPCDGWRLSVSQHPWDKPEPVIHADRYWSVPERMRDGSPRTMMVDRMRTFNHRTGEHNDYDPMIDLSQWKPKGGVHD